MTKKQKLELTWIGKENRPMLEPRILLENSLMRHVVMNNESNAKGEMATTQNIAT